jgi:transposase
MVLERRSVGLDVHARSIVAGVLDVETGELWSERLLVATEAVLGWVGSLPGPVAVAYEAGPTGFGLAEGCGSSGCGVWWWPVQAGATAWGSGQTDRRDAERLARLLHIGDCPRCGCRPWPRRPPGI